MPYELAEPADAAQAVTLTEQALFAVEREIEKLPRSSVDEEASDDDHK